MGVMCRLGSLCTNHQNSPKSAITVIIHPNMDKSDQNTYINRLPSNPMRWRLTTGAAILGLAALIAGGSKTSQADAHVEPLLEPYHVRCVAPDSSSSLADLFPLVVDVAQNTRTFVKYCDVSVGRRLHYDDGTFKEATIKVRASDQIYLLRVSRENYFDQEEVPSFNVSVNTTPSDESYRPIGGEWLGTVRANGENPYHPHRNEEIQDAMARVEAALKNINNP